MVKSVLNSITKTFYNQTIYNHFGKANGMTTGAGAVVNNQTSECDCLEVPNPGAPMEMTYTYEANRNLETIRGTNKPWLNQDFIYNPLNRLTDAIGAYGTYSYSYDNVGNRLTKTANGQTESYAYITGTNKIDEVTGGNQTVGYGYDNNGNITSIGDRTLIYNQINRLVRIEENSTVIGEYKYNGSGQRVKKTVDGETTIFHYDFDGKIISESITDGKFRKEYLYTSYTLKAMVDTTSGELYYFLNDFLGTPQMLVDSTNTIVWEATYKPFGEALLNSKSPVENNFRFAGQYYDSETGLHYNWHRYYDPKLGRYLRPDPIGLAEGINLYAYAENNPINAIDPQGLVHPYLLRLVPYLLRLAPWAAPVAVTAYDYTYNPSSSGIPQAINEIERWQERTIRERSERLKEIDEWIEKQKEILMLGHDTCLEVALENQNKNCYSEDEWKRRKELCIGKYQED